MSSSGWCTIESDPGVFTELIAAFGAKNCQVEELYSLDVDSLREIAYVPEVRPRIHRESDDRPVDEDAAATMFFAKQVITNACATQAILSILLNASDVELGEELTAFREFTIGLPPDMRGDALGGYQQIRDAHNSFARPEPFVMTSKAATKDDDVFHFIAYVPHNGGIYELDGLKQGPIRLCDVADGEDWLEKVEPEIQKRIQRYASSEIRFNLMAVVKDQRSVCRELIEARRNEGAGDDDPTVAELQERLAAEEAKFERWNVENTRRKHNYVPFIMNLLKILAEKGELERLVREASEKRAR